MRAAPVFAATLSLIALGPAGCNLPTTDSFCQVYNPVIVQSGDGVITAPSHVKRRLYANELIYREQCKKGKAS